MKGTIAMTIDGPKTKIEVNVCNVDVADKCVVVDNILTALDAEGEERLLILAMVAKATGKKFDEEEESNNESGCI